jgi:hypothetical protein
MMLKSKIKTGTGTYNVDSLHYRTFGNGRKKGIKRSKRRRKTKNEKRNNLPASGLNPFSPVLK